MTPLQTTRWRRLHTTLSLSLLRRSRGWLVLELRTRLASARAMEDRCDLRLSERLERGCRSLQV